MDYEYFMRKSYEQALLALEYGDVPIGCVVTYNDKIIGKGFNQRNKHKNSLLHAEIIAINEACKKIEDWRLENCEIFVTVEPCPMCAGAIVQSRIKQLVFGAKNAKSGSAGSILNILQNHSLNHQVEIIGGILEKECSQLMREYFKILRQSKNACVLKVGKRQ